MMKKAILGISTNTLTPNEIELFDSMGEFLHGIILFKRNFLHDDGTLMSVNSIRNFIEDIKTRYPHVLIAIDQEGGKVQRLSTSITGNVYPSASMFAKMYTEDPEQAKIAVYTNYKAIGKELKSLGFDINFAPVADLLIPHAHDVIGDRSFGASVTQVVDLCKQAMRALYDSGIACSIKHVPGHGRAVNDTHEKCAIIDADLSTLNETDFAVFKELFQYYNDFYNNSDEFVNRPWCYAMTAHVIYKCFEENTPITLSSKAIDYIKDNLKCSMPIITDALEMKALQGTIGENAQKAINAGCDMLLQCDGDINHMNQVWEVLN